MSIPGSAAPFLLAKQPKGQYLIERSLRFNSSDSAYLSRTPTSAGNRKTWTWAGWVKKSSIDTSSGRGIFSCDLTSTSDSTFFELRFGTGAYPNSLAVNGYNTNWRITTQVFRDASAWYHIVLAVDTTQATGANRIKIYVNGSQIASFMTSNDPTQNTDLGINNTTLHNIGKGYYDYLSGYLADIHFIDGQALTPSSFGEFDTNGIWQPKAYTGSYGTNGFQLKFADNSAATAAALGKDTSGNGNNWTPNNLSVTAGAGNDSLVDVPTNGSQTDSGIGGEVRGNYATLNPLDQTLTQTGSITNGNLDYAASSSGPKAGRATVGITSGKWYWEITHGGGNGSYGVASSLYKVSDVLVTSPYGWGYVASGNKFNSGETSYAASFTTGDVIGVALDLDAGSLTFYKNNVSQGVAFTGISGTIFPVFGTSSVGTVSFTANFGQRPFAYPAPSGFKALCTANLPSTTITTSGSYTGNGVADGPFVYLNGVPTAMTVNGNAVTFGTHADKLSNGFKIRTTSTTYNLNASVYNYSITSTGAPFKTARAQSN